VYDGLVLELREDDERVATAPEDPRALAESVELAAAGGRREYVGFSEVFALHDGAVRIDYSYEALDGAPTGSAVDIPADVVGVFAAWVGDLALPPSPFAWFTDRAFEDPGRLVQSVGSSEPARDAAPEEPGRRGVRPCHTPAGDTPA